MPLNARTRTGLVTSLGRFGTEVLDLPFLDFACFAVRLDPEDRFDTYLARLHNIVGDRPLILELDSLQGCDWQQVQVVGSQVRRVFQAGCAGVFAFPWFDRPNDPSVDVHDRSVRRTDQTRQVMRMPDIVRRAFGEVPFERDLNWPKVSVVVCSYNGANKIRSCCDGLVRLEYRSFEVIVVDDGSTDGTAAIAKEYGFRVISSEHRGLCSAPNTGLAASHGEIVAYLDDDAWPDSHWLQYLAFIFMGGEYAGLGGRIIAPPVAKAPGGPVSVLVSDREAEMIMGSNMALRRSCLETVGGFDPQYRTAGDDVDICWRLHTRGWRLGYSPAAIVWHRPRNSVRGYWRQQVGYGKAESLLRNTWPEKYSSTVLFSGRYYGKGLIQPLGSIAGLLGWLPLTIEWYLGTACAAILSGIGVFYSPLFCVWAARGSGRGAVYTGPRECRPRTSAGFAMSSQQKVGAGSHHGWPLSAPATGTLLRTMHRRRHFQKSWPWINAGT